MSNFGANLKASRQAQNISLGKLAKDVNAKYHTSISKSMLSRWENGEVVPNLYNAIILCKYFNEDLINIKGGDEDND